MIEMLTEFFNSENYMPHGHCFLYDPKILWLHVISDTCIGASYFMISAVLVRLLKIRQDTPFKRTFLLFAAFIFFCGLTHLMGIWVLWYPDYAFEGILKAITAISSVTTLCVIIRIFPNVAIMVNPAGRLLSSLVESSEDAIISKDVRGSITSWNASAEKLFGYSAQEVLGKNISVIIPVDKQQEEKFILEKINSGQKIETLETIRLSKKGDRIPVSLTVSPIYGDLGRVIGASKIIRDITERREIEKTRNQLRESQKMEALGQLTGGIAHDFNNLLAVIIGNLDILSEKISKNDALTKYITPSIQAAEHGANLTKQLLSFGRKQALQPKIVSMNDLVSSFSTLVRNTLSERIEPIMALDPNICNVRVDPTELQSALLNLVVNARDAMPDGGKLILETKNVTLDEDYAAANSEVVPGDYGMIAITDTGIGMTPEVVARAFEPFFTTKEIGKGSGLGLSMVYGFVKQSMGHIKIYSELSHGTSIKIYLPRVNGPKMHTKPKNTHASEERIDPIVSETLAPEQRNGKIILVVEDNKEVLALTSSMVEHLGYTVLTAQTGDAALKIIEERDDIDLLLTDVMLPGILNGPAMAKRAVALRPKLKVLFNSGYAEHAIIKTGLLDENVHLISKPFRKKQLADMIADILK